jgi:hypothetical protein
MGSLPPFVRVGAAEPRARGFRAGRGHHARDDTLHHRRKGRGRHHPRHLAHELGIGRNRRHLLLPEIHDPAGQILDLGSRIFGAILSHV